MTEADGAGKNDLFTQVPPTAIDGSVDPWVAHTAAFFTQYFGALDDECGFWFYLYVLPTRRSWWFPCSEEGYLAAAVQAHKTECLKHDVFFPVAPARVRGRDGDRHKANDAAALLSVWADVDVAHDVHAKKGLPPTFDEAERLIATVGAEPTMMVNSGHGLQPYWMLKEPLVVDSEIALREATGHPRLWISSLQARAMQLGYTVDAVQDLARIMRVPGTWNRKAEPVRVEWVTNRPDATYDVSELETFLVEDQALSLSARHPRQRQQMARTRVGGGLFHTLGVEVAAARGIAAYADHKDGAAFFEALKAVGARALSVSERDAAILLWLMGEEWQQFKSQLIVPDWQRCIDWAIYCRLQNPADQKRGKADRIDYWEKTFVWVLGQMGLQVSDIDGSEGDAAELAESEFLADRIGDEQMAAVLVQDTLQIEQAKDDDEKGTAIRGAIAHVGELIGIAILSITRYPSDTGTSYRLYVPGGCIRLDSTGVILKQKAFIEKVADVTKIIIRSHPPAAWNNIAQAILQASEDVSLGEAASEAAGALSILKTIVDSVPPVRFDAKLERGRRSCLLLNDHTVAFNAEHIHATRRAMSGSQVSASRMAEMLSAAGALPKKLEFYVVGSTVGRMSSEEYWVIHRSKLGLGHQDLVGSLSEDDE